MRKVRNQNHNTSNASLLLAHPAVVSARHVEKIVENHMSHDQHNSFESKYDDQELRAMQRSPRASRPSGNLFSVLLQQLAWGNFSR